MFNEEEINIDSDLANENVGDLWINFCESINPAHSKEYNSAYNLIALLGKVDDATIFINSVLVDESISRENKSSEFRTWFIRSLLDSLQTMGITVDKEQVTPNSLKDLINIVNAIYTLHDMNDILGAHEILTSEDTDPIDKLISVIDRVYIDYDVDYLYDLIIGVEQRTIKGILIGLNLLGEDDEHIEGYVKSRILDNKGLLEGTFAWHHITNDGAIGLEMRNLFNIYINELSQLVNEHAETYFKQILSLMLISSLPNQDIEKAYKNVVHKHTEDISEIYRHMETFSGVKLNG